MNRFLFISNRTPLFSDVAVNKNDVDIFLKGYNGSMKLSCISTISVLEKNNIGCKLIDPIDIDKQIEEYNPTHVIVSGLWMSPSELKSYVEKFKNIDNWIVIKHGEISSASIDRNLIKWIKDYLDMEKVRIASISPRTFNDLKTITGALNSTKRIHLLPTLHNIPIDKIKRKQLKDNIIDIGCFGVIRVLKNQLIQAIAAIEYAKRKQIKLRFHITINPPYERNPGPQDIEGFGQILKNMRELFSSLDKDKFELIEHRWTSREIFLDLVKEMDLGLNLSLSESFNLICTDFVFNNVPVIGSKEIFWLPKECIADNTNTEDMISVMSNVIDNYETKKIYEKTINNLIEWNSRALDSWLKL